MRVSPRLPDATIRRNLAFEPTAEQWLVIETAFGGTLSEAAREALTEAATGYLSLAEAEVVAPRVRVAQSLLEAMEQGARALEAAVAWPDDEERWDSRNQLETMLDDALLAIRNHYRDDEHYREMGGLNSAGQLAHTLIIFGEARERVRKQLEAFAKPAKDASSTAALGEAWGAFVRDMRDLFRDHGKKVSSRKDSDKNKTGAASPFVAFVAAVRDALPDHRPSAQSLDALAARVSAALASGRKNGDSPAE